MITQQQVLRCVHQRGWRTYGQLLVLKQSAPVSCLKLQISEPSTATLKSVTGHSDARGLGMGSARTLADHLSR